MNKWDKTFMQIAELFAQHSSCIKLKVGAVLVKENRVISCGYNGTPSGLVNCNEHFVTKLECNEICDNDGLTRHHIFSVKYEIHAEQNCLGFYAKNGGIVDDSCVLYVTTAPCCDCAKTILTHGIKKVVYKNDYKNSYGIELLQETGIEVIKLLEE